MLRSTLSLRTAAGNEGCGRGIKAAAHIENRQGAVQAMSETSRKNAVISTELEFIWASFASKVPLLRCRLVSGPPPSAPS